MSRLPRPDEGRAAVPVAAAMARTSHVLSDTPSTAAARSASPFSDSGSRRLTRAVLSSPSSAGAAAGAAGAGSATGAGVCVGHELHVATAQPHLDHDVAAAGQLVGSGGEHVEQQQPHGRVGGRGEEPGRRLQVRPACFGGGGEVAAELLDERVQIHAVIVTSL